MSEIEVAVEENIVSCWNLLENSPLLALTFVLVGVVVGIAFSELAHRLARR